MYKGKCSGWRPIFISGQLPFFAVTEYGGVLGCRGLLQFESLKHDLKFVFQLNSHKDHASAYRLLLNNTVHYTCQHSWHFKQRLVLTD